MPLNDFNLPVYLDCLFSGLQVLIQCDIWEHLILANTASWIEVLWIKDKSHTLSYPSLNLSELPLKIHPPVRVLLQGLDRLLDIADVPELDLAVVSTAGQVVLSVGVEVQVTHQLAMGVLDAVDLTGGETEGERGEEREDRRHWGEEKWEKRQTEKK